jgi:transcriptional regulator with XRE-family HTH domain
MLRALRAGTGLTAEQVAERLGFSRSKISRLENGRRGASAVDILRLCELYRVDDEHRLRLTELAAEGKQRGWRPPFSLPHSDYIGLEAEAVSISDYGLAIVPGLLQTPDYARAIVGAAVSVPEPRIVEERVRVRMARQQLLRSDKGPTFEAVLDESVLHRIVGSPAVMLAQLRRLLEMSRLPKVTIRVVPYDAGTVPAGVNKFIILRFALSGIADIVLIEELTSHRYLEEPEEVETYSATFRTLANLSADPVATRAMFLTKIAMYESTIR